ncbi:MAG: ABC transporter permease [Ignisphaera sp.]|nr:ABC transporter permease [Ignisphaera sp.]MCX8167488.1 ABC transporter permease [Ignisphaera sp.]MDW8084648.1 ABC transporter permease [Ignisphaera sp.]
MVKVSIARRELPLYITAPLRVVIAMLGLLIAIIAASLTFNQHPTATLSLLINSFLDLNVFRYVTVFLPTALGLIIAYSGGLWNLGAEGQIVVGAMGAAFIALFTPLGAIEYAGVATSLLFSSVIGAAWALLAIILKIYFGINEALTTLMMNYIAYYLVDYLVYGPWRGRGVYGYPETDMIPVQCRLQRVPGYSFSLHTLITSLLFIILIFLFLYRTRVGISIRALSSSFRAVELSGLSSAKLAILAFTLSGALAGFAGGMEVLVYHRKLVPGAKIGAGMGYTSIMVAWLSSLNPIAVLISAYYVSALYIFSLAIQIGSTNVGDAITRMVIGSIFLLTIISEFLTRYRIVLRFGK